MENALASQSRKRTLVFLGALTLAVTVLHGTVAEIPAKQASAVFTECADGIDNDHDGVIDYPQDPQCLSLHDDSEGPTGRGIFLTLSDGLDVVEAGDSLTYTVALRTERSEQKVVDVYFQMPHQTNLISASEGGKRLEEMVVWRNVSIFPGRVHKLYVTVSTTPYAQEGLLLVAEALSEGEKSTDTTRVEGRDGELVLNPQSKLRLSITDGKKYVQPSDSLTYVIRVQNPTHIEQEFDLHAQIPTDTAYEHASGTHRVTRRAIDWENQAILPGDTREYTFTVRTHYDAAEFFAIKTRASIGAVSDTDTTSVHFGLLPTDFRVSTTDNLVQTTNDSLVTYDIFVKNTTDRLATEVDINNALPQYVEYVDSTEGGRWIGKNVRWTGLTISPYGERHLRVTGRVRSDAPRGARLRNATLVKGYEAVDITEVGAGNLADGSAYGQESRDVVVRKFADRAEVRPGSNVNFTVAVENTSGRTLRNIRVEDRMDSPYAQVLQALGAERTGNTLVWMIPELAPGQGWKTTYSVIVSGNSPHGTSIPNIVTVSGEGLATVSLTDRIHTSDLAVISNLPPTGAAFDALFLALTGALGALQTVVQRKRLLLSIA